MTQLIAERKLLYSLKGSAERKEFIVRIGIPYVVQEGTVDFTVGDKDIFGCHIEIAGLKEPCPEVYGADSLQAITLATIGIESLLKRLQIKYDIYFPTGETYFDAPEAEQTANITTEIKTLEEKLRQAELGPDAAFFEEHLADDALLDGVRAKAKVVEAHRAGGSAKFTKVEMRDFDIIPHGDDAAVVSCTGTFTGAMGEFTLKFMRVWVRTAAGWRIVAATTAK